MISLEEAQARTLALLRPAGTERVWLDDALGRVLAADAVATLDQPPAANSAMDGVACRAEDLSPGCVLAVREVIAAGGWPRHTLGPGEAARIMTGAPVPPGATCVVRREDTDDGVDRVTVHVPVRAGTNVRPAGEDVASGQRFLPAGRPLQAPDLGLLASQGVRQVTVGRRPVVAVIPTGDEVHEPGDPLPRGHIVSSNTHALLAMIREAGGEPRYLGIGRDDRDGLKALFGSVRGADLVLTIGGVSVGDFDHVRAALDDLGAEAQFWRVAMRPGKPNALAVIGQTPWIGLPGNPVSAQISFLQFVRPAILAMAGATDVYLPTLPAELEHDQRGHPDFLFLFRGVLTFGDRPTVRATGPQGSGISRSMSEANCLFVVPPGDGFVGRGGVVRAQLLPRWLPAQATPGLR